jgi:Zn-dependent peptidase ImmA (M78 family)
MIVPARRAAREARERLGLRLDQPIVDILTTVEDDAGVPVTVASLPRDFAGVVQFDGDQAYIFTNGDDPVVRQRFTLAHEYGHVCLGHGTVYDTLDLMFGNESDEVDANEFAGEFLLPRAALDAWLEHQEDPAIDIEVVVRLARAFGVSADVARIRLEKAGRLRKGTKAFKAVRDAITFGEHSRLHSQLQLGDYPDTLTVIRTDKTVAERVGAPSPLPRLPRTVSQRVRAVYASGLADLDELAARTKQHVDRLRQDLADVEPPARGYADDDVF